MDARRILISLSITVGISLAIAYILTFFGMSFLRTFGLIFILHFFIFGAINYVTGVWAAIKLRQIETEQMKSLDSQGAYVNCSFCGSPSFVPIILNSPNSYTCTECQKENAILIGIETAQPTDPITDLDPTSVIRGSIDDDDFNEEKA